MRKKAFIDWVFSSVATMGLSYTEFNCSSCGQTSRIDWFSNYGEGFNPPSRCPKCGAKFVLDEGRVDL